MKNMLRNVFGVCLITLFVTGCGENQIETPQEEAKQEEVESEEKVVVKDGYHTEKYRTLLFEIPDSWDKWSDSYFSGGKEFKFSDYDNYESVYWAADKFDGALTGKEYLESKFEEMSEKYGNLVVRYGEIDGFDSALISYSGILMDGTKRKTTAYIVCISEQGFVVFGYDCDEHVTPEHKDEFEELIDSIRFTE